MKLILAIMSNDDAPTASTALNKEGYSVTRLATTGGFLRAGNTTLIIGCEDEKVDKKHIYKIVSFTGNRLYGVPYSVANSIVDKTEYSQLNKVEFTDEKVSIKEVCIPVKVDRLGNITKIDS